MCSLGGRRLAASQGLLIAGAVLSRLFRAYAFSTRTSYDDTLAVIAVISSVSDGCGGPQDEGEANREVDVVRVAASISSCPKALRLT